MGQIDYPLTDGVHEENDNKLGKPSTLITCDNAYYELIGRLAMRGGFHGNATTDRLDFATTGATRHAAETADDLFMASDEGMWTATETSMAGSGLQRGEAWYQESSTPLPMPAIATQSATALGGNVFTSCDIVKAGGYWYASVGGVIYYSADLLDWSVAYSAGNVNAAKPWCAMCPGVTSGGAGVVAYQGDATTVNNIVSIYGGNTTSATILGAAAYVCGCVFSVGNDAIVVLVDATKLYVYVVRASSVALKMTYTHSVTPFKVQANGSGTSMYVSLQTGTYGSSTGKYITFTMPADLFSGTWSAVPAALNAWPSGAGVAYYEIHNFDVTSTGYALASDCEASWPVTRLRKYRFAANDSPLFPGQSSGIGGPQGGAVVPVTRVFALPGKGGSWFFGCASDWPEPGNALLLCHTDLTGNASSYDCEVVSVSDVQQTPVGGSGYATLVEHCYNSKWCMGSPYVDSDGSIVLCHVKIQANGVYRAYISRFRACGGTGGIRRSVATSGSLCIASGGCQEHQGSRYSPGYTVCQPNSVVQSGTTASLVAGTYAVRMLLEFDLVDGTWQSAASIPRLVTLDGTHAINVAANCIWCPLLATKVPARLVVFVAPPGSNTYYRSAQFDMPYPGGPVFASRSVGGDVLTVNTAGEVLYENYEPPRVYPGDCNGVAWAGGRMWRWLDWKLWHTHSVSSNQATQWAGDDFRLEFDSAVEGVGQLQGQPVVITSKAIYLLEGDGPDRTGNGSYSVRSVSSLALGCLDQRGVVETPAGLCWPSVRGIELLPPGGGVPQSVGQPVRVTYGNGTYSLGAHCQARSLAAWWIDSTEAPSYSAPSAIVFDYLRGVWMTWTQTLASPISAAFSWGSSFGIVENDVAGSYCYFSYDAKLDGGALTTYPQWITDTIHGGGQNAINTTIETGDVRIGASNAGGIWRGVWMLGARVVNDPTGLVYTMTQTADGVAQSPQIFASAQGTVDMQWFRAMAAIPVSYCDASSFKITITTSTGELGPGIGQTPSITSLTLDYDPTGNLSTLAKGNRS